MIELVKTLWMGKTHYVFDYSDGDDGDPKRRQHKPKPDDVRVPITEAQAAKGIDACAALYETGRLA